MLGVPDDGIRLCRSKKVLVDVLKSVLQEQLRYSFPCFIHIDFGSRKYDGGQVNMKFLMMNTIKVHNRKSIFHRKSFYSRVNGS